MVRERMGASVDGCVSVWTCKWVGGWMVACGRFGNMWCGGWVVRVCGGKEVKVCGGWLRVGRRRWGGGWGLGACGVMGLCVWRVGGYGNKGDAGVVYGDEGWVGRAALCVGWWW